MKKLLVILFALLLTIGAVAVAEEPPTLDNSYFSYGFDAEGYGSMQYYIHFYAAQPVLGNVFYINHVPTQTSWAGTWVVYPAEREYSCHESRQALVDGEEALTGVAPYTVVFMDFDGNILDGCAWDGADQLFNDMSVLSSMGSGPMLYRRDTDPEHSVFTQAYEAERGVAYREYMADDDATSTVRLNHNGTYLDMMVMLTEGTWVMTAREDGGYDYALTPDDPSNTAAVLSASADAQTAQYLVEGDEAIVMHNTAVQGPAVSYSFLGTFPTEYGVDGEIKITLYDDQSAVLSVALFGNEAELDRGTWSVTPSYEFTVITDSTGTFVSQMDMETYAITMPVSCEPEGFGAIETVLSIQAE